MTHAWEPGPPRPAIATGVDVWRVELDGAPPVPAGLLDGAELARARGIRSGTAGRRWAASRWALREVLARYLDEDPATIALARGEHGKPELASEPGRLAFNLSHSGGLALVAVSGGPSVGVDVERIAPRRDLLALAKRSLDADAVATVRAAGEGQQAEAFYAAWTRHEARVKCGGAGFGGSPPGAPMAVTELDVGAGYAAATAVPGETAPVHRLYQLDLT